MINNADLDGNQVLDFEEFLQMMVIKVSPQKFILCYKTIITKFSCSSSIMTIAK